MGTESEESFKGLFDYVDVTRNRLGADLTERNERLTKIIEGIRDLDFSGVCDAKIDMFGDAYEYLMNMYASNAGKSGGEFFTPQEVSELLARIVIGDRASVSKVYDPACGSGSLLLKFAKFLGEENVRVGFFGQEINPTTYNFCRMNMFLHHINYDRFHIARGDTLISPQRWDDEPFDAIVSNPPYSKKWVGDEDPTLINDPRFSPADVSDSGVEVSKIMKPVSRFANGNPYGRRRRAAIEDLTAFFEKYRSMTKRYPVGGRYREVVVG